MKVPLKSGGELKISAIKLGVYYLRNNFCLFVNEIFDKMHCQGQVKFITNHTMFNFLVFVIQKMDIKGKKKSSIVVDIWKLNKIVFSNSYLLSLQSEIITKIQKFTNLAFFNTVFFFYQWLLYPNHYFIFTVMIFCRQKTF